MVKKVLKFGGTSVGSIKRILHAAKIIKKEHDDGNKVIASGRVHFNDPKEAQIRYMAVNENLKRKGIGSEIVENL